ncbi:enoyl-CoA hydratase/isomerase family protein [Nocardia sp. NPDC052112]|uniref:enoyl-CoA hydratase/isomerase family protein n=1 Tax=Nocardia sp. NPDC052112 TaxID=3155646 RepID=UPI003415C038
MQLVEISRSEDAVATLTLNWQAKKNALSIAMRDEVSDALDALVGDESVKVVVITGAGGVFSAGFDLREFGATDPAVQQALWPSSDRFHHTVLRFPLPTIAAVDGPALAGGFDLATLCDIRIASETAVFAHPEQAFADVLYRPLAELVGGAAARYLTLSGRRIDAAEALRIGLVAEVVPAAELMDTVGRLARDIARGPREALVRTKAKAVQRMGIDVGMPTLAM